LLMDSANGTLITAVREGLTQLADPAKAPVMQAYMKSAMPYLGVQTPPQRLLYRQIFAAHPLASFEEWQATVLTLWREARYREERYVAIALTGDKHYRQFQRVEALPLYEELIVTGAWWDLVDELATHRMGDLLRQYPEPMRTTMLAWSRDPDMWKRRTAILCQTTFKAASDEQLLFACIEPNLGDKEFFIRKAIGWALREYAKARPESVRRYVREHEALLSGLSRREAMKHLSPNV
jgi:3-methyladenine DNA glycosylase AlkD